MDFFGFFLFLSKLLRAPKIAENWPEQHNKLFILPEGQKSPGRRPKTSAGARSKVESQTNN